MNRERNNKNKRMQNQTGEHMNLKQLLIQGSIKGAQQAIEARILHKAEEN